MGIDDYFGVGKPDEKKAIELNENPVQLIANALASWELCLERITPKYYGIFDEAMLDEMYEEATRLLRPYENLHLPVISKQHFIPLEVLPYGHSYYCGIFYTALLNTATNERKMIVPAHINAGFFGYRMQKGVMELYADSASSGLRASGGTIFSYGTNSSFAQEASGGVFVNYGRPRHFGCNARGGLFINRNFVDDFASAVSGGLFIQQGKVIDFASLSRGTFINYGDVLANFGNGASGGFFINAGASHYFAAFDVSAGQFINVGYIGPKNTIGFCASGGHYIDATCSTISAFIRRIVGIPNSIFRSMLFDSMKHSYRRKNDHLNELLSVLHEIAVQSIVDIKSIDLLVKQITAQCEKWR